MWLDGNILEGVGGDELRGDPQKVYRTMPLPLTHEPMIAVAAREYVEANAGGTVRPPFIQRIFDDFDALRASWFNGTGYAGPNPTWP